MKKIIVFICMILLVFTSNLYGKQDIDYLITNINKNTEIIAKTHDPKLLLQNYNMIADAIALDCDMITKSCTCNDCIRQCQMAVTINKDLIDSIDRLLEILENIDKTESPELGSLYLKIQDSKKIILGCRRRGIVKLLYQPKIPQFHDIEPASAY